MNVRLINVWYIKAPGCRWRWDVPLACLHTLTYNLSIALKPKGVVVCVPSGASQSISGPVFLTWHVTSCRPKWDGLLSQDLHASAEMGGFFGCFLFFLPAIGIKNLAMTCDSSVFYCMPCDDAEGMTGDDGAADE